MKILSVDDKSENLYMLEALLRGHGHEVNSASDGQRALQLAGGGYDYEMEDLAGLDAEIVEGPTDEDGFIKFAQDADAVYAKGMRFTKKVVDGLPAKCRAIVLGSVGVDSVDVVAATARGIPVTNCPDTFIEEVADHAMALLLSSFRRVIEQDRMVRENRWREGRPALLQIPRLMGQTLGFIAFGHVARAVAMRAASTVVGHLSGVCRKPCCMPALSTAMKALEPATAGQYLSSTRLAAPQRPLRWCSGRTRKCETVMMVLASSGVRFCASSMTMNWFAMLRPRM